MRVKASDRPDLLNDIPRGNPNRFLNDQSLPQSRFLRQFEFEDHPDFCFDPQNPDGMVLLGRIGDKLYGVRDDRHLTTFAGTRAGKTSNLIATLYYYNGSTLNNDSKGSIAKEVAERRHKMGHKQYVLDPYAIVKGDAARFRCRFNPLNGLDLNDIEVIERAETIVEAIIVETGKEAEPHWNDTAGELINGLILYVRFGSNVRDEDRHLGTVRRLLMNAKKT
ncbi:MAG: type IV secretory system conjugative DNA transfer family protein, partial [Pseudomonadota bacterium]